MRGLIPANVLDKLETEAWKYYTANGYSKTCLGCAAN